MPDQPRPFDEWHEDHGDVIWWLWPIEQAPWIGTPLDIGRTVSFDITVQIGIDVYEVEPKRIGDTGGWPWRDADEETEARLFWTPLSDANALDEAIRDHIRGGPDPFKEPAVVESDGSAEGQAAMAVLAASLSPAQRKLLTRLHPARGWGAADLRFTYHIDTPHGGLQTCSALARRQMVVSEASGDRPYENRGQGHVRLTPLGALIRKRVMEAAI